MHISLSKARVSYGLAALLMVLFSFTEIPVMQIEKAVITPFHFAILLVSVPILLTMPGVIVLNRLILLLAGYIVLINLLHFGGIRVTSFIYTLVFFYEYIFLVSLLRFIRLEDLKKVFLVILILYFLNILITFFIIQLNLYSDTIGFIFKAYFGSRPMGFSSEPSYAAFIVTVAFICYNELRYATEGKNSLPALIIYVLTVALSTSSYGLLYVAICVIYILFREAKRMPRNFRLFFYAIFIGVVAAAIAYLSTISSGPIQRVFNVASAFLSDSPISEKLDAVNEVDASAWARLGPTWLLFQNNGIDAGLIFGHGSGASSLFFNEQMIGILVDKDREFLDLGLIPGFIYDFGLIGFTILVFFFVHLLRGNRFFIFLVVLFFFNAGINTQILWFALISMGITAGMIKEIKQNNIK